MVTHPKVFMMPTPLTAAFAAVDAWGAGGNLQLIAESDGYLEKLREIEGESSPPPVRGRRQQAGVAVQSLALRRSGANI
jgi:hypothetical protein